MIKKFLLASICVIATQSAFAFESTIADSAVGGTEQSKLENLLGYARDKDTAAFTSGLMQGISNSTCAMFQPGEKVFVTDVKLSGLNKIRKQGGANEYWIVREALQR
jgi:hypothetical protein